MVTLQLMLFVKLVYRLWDTRSMKEVKTIDLPQSVTSMVLSKDGNVLIATYGKTISFWDPERWGESRWKKGPQASSKTTIQFLLLWYVHLNILGQAAVTFCLPGQGRFLLAVVNYFVTGGLVRVQWFIYFTLFTENNIERKICYVQ